MATHEDGCPQSLTTSCSIDVFPEKAISDRRFDRSSHFAPVKHTIVSIAFDFPQPG